MRGMNFDAGTNSKEFRLEPPAPRDAPEGTRVPHADPMPSRRRTEGAFMDRAPLRGRSEQMESMISILRHVRQTGRAAAAVVSGPAGFGKSALLAEIAEQAARLGFHTGRGRAGGSASVGPLALLFSALRSGHEPLLSAKVFDELALLHDRGPWLVDRLATTLAERAAQGPLLIMLDDVDCADELSAFALRILPGRLAAHPVMWLLAGRRAPFTADDAADWEVPVTSVEVGPLDDGAIEQLAQDRLGAMPDERVRGLLHAAEGSPLLAVELVSGLAAEARRRAPGRGPAAEDRLPERLVISVRRSLAALPSEAVRVLRAGSVLGRSFDIVGAAELLGGAAADVVLPFVEQLVHAELLDDDGRRLMFRLDLVRRAIYEDIPPTVRRAMHRSAARFLVSSGQNPAEAAVHVQLSALPGDQEAVDVLRRAAAAVMSREPETAVGFIESALELIGPADDLWMEVCEDAVCVLARAGRAAQAVETAERMFAQGCPTGVALRVDQMLVEPLWSLGRLEQLRERAEKLLCAGEHPQSVRSRLLAEIALGASRDTDLAYARATARQALSITRGLDAPDARSLALWAAGEIELSDGRIEQALEYFRERRLLAGLSHAADEIRALQVLDRFDEAEELIGRIAAAEAGRQAPELAMLAAWATARQRHALGALGCAETAAQRALDLSGTPGVDRFASECRLILTDVARQRGDSKAALALIETVERTSPGDAVTLALAGLLARDSRVGSPQGTELSSALAAVRSAVESAEAGAPRLRWDPSWTPAAARVAVDGGDRELARRVAQLAQTAALRNPYVVRFGALARHARGLAEQDASALAEAVELLRAGVRRGFLAAALVDYGAMLVRGGSRREGTEALDEAGGLLREVGAAGEIRGVQQVLRELGVRRRWATGPARPLHGWEALTEAEKRVARLVAEGRSNKAVAAELFLSPNTVGTHLRSVFAKLDVSSRAQLVRAVPTTQAPPRFGEGYTAGNAGDEGVLRRGEEHTDERRRRRGFRQ